MQVGSFHQKVTTHMMIACGIFLIVFGIFLYQRVTTLAEQIIAAQNQSASILNGFDSN